VLVEGVRSRKAERKQGGKKGLKGSPEEQGHLRSKGELTAVGRVLGNWGAAEWDWGDRKKRRTQGKLKKKNRESLSRNGGEKPGERKHEGRKVQAFDENLPLEGGPPGRYNREG